MCRPPRLRNFHWKLPAWVSLWTTYPGPHDNSPGFEVVEPWNTRSNGRESARQKPIRHAAARVWRRWRQRLLGRARCRRNAVLAQPRARQGRSASGDQQGRCDASHGAHAFSCVSQRRRGATRGAVLAAEGHGRKRRRGARRRHHRAQAAAAAPIFAASGRWVLGGQAQNVHRARVLQLRGSQGTEGRAALLGAQRFPKASLEPPRSSCSSEPSCKSTRTCSFEPSLCSGEPACWSSSEPALCSSPRWTQPSGESAWSSHESAWCRREEEDEGASLPATRRELLCSLCQPPLPAESMCPAC